jgi:hypothetical protein
LIAELSPGGVARLFRSHPGRKVLLNLHLEMEAHLLFHLALVSSPAQRRKQPAPESREKLDKMLQASDHHARPRFRLFGLQRFGDGVSLPGVRGYFALQLFAASPRQFKGQHI